MTEGGTVTRRHLSDTARRAIDAYGGEGRWRELQTVEAHAEFTGFLFRFKSRRAPSGLHVWCSVHQPLTKLDPIDSKGNVGILDGQEVRLEAPDGTVINRRPNARSWFPYRHPLLYWDVLDLTYFLGYASWNYFVLPALLLRQDIEWTETKPGELRSRFPDHLPTHHAEKQRFLFAEETGLLERYDYVPEVVAPPPIPYAANVILERGSVDGIPYEAKRRVTWAPRNGKPWKRPVLVGMRFWDYRVS